MDVVALASGASVLGLCVVVVAIAKNLLLARRAWLVWLLAGRSRQAGGRVCGRGGGGGRLVGRLVAGCAGETGGGEGAWTKGGGLGGVVCVLRLRR